MDRYGIIGYPLDHSFSPVIHNKGFKHLNINAFYDKFEILPEDFKKKIMLLKNSNIKGYNVTVPYKQKILPFIDEIDPVAKKTGAINTIKKSGQKWIGYNTDVFGFLSPLKMFVKPIKTVLLIGAGGSANAVSFALLSEFNVNEINIVNRTLKRAETLGNKLKTEFNFNLDVFDMKKLKSKEKKYDLIVNTTNIGMGHLETEYPIDIAKLYHKETIVYDLIYNPELTLFLKMAREKNLSILNGAKMLIAQAKKSFKIWTGQAYPDQIIDERIFYK